MPLENATTINELNPSYPAGSDPIGQGDDHIRMIKQTLVNFYNTDYRQLLEKEYLKNGYNLVAGSFEQGGTVNGVMDVLLYEAEGIAYSWGASFPKTVDENSTPAGTGGIGPLAWIDRSAVFKDVVSVLDKGAVADSTNGLDGTDSTAAFNAAIAECLATGKSLRIPRFSKGYRFTSTVDFRQVNVLPNNATLYVSHAGIGIIFGGNASNANNPSQYFGTVIRAAGTAGLNTPTMRGIGIKGQYITIEFCLYVQLYANDTPPNNALDYSCAYSSLYLKNVDTIQLYGIANGWINENQFYMNRTHKIYFVNGQYGHNHNKFYNGTMEGPGVIDLQVGSSNHFYGLRHERSGAVPTDTLDINFGVNTWNNIIETSWVSSSGYSNSPYNPIGTQVTATDLGSGNSVLTSQDTHTDEVSLFALSEATPFVSYANDQLNGTLNKNTDINGVRFIQHLVNGRFKLLGNFAPVLMDDRRIPVRNGDMFMIFSDGAFFRPILYLYDLNGNWIRNEPSDPEMLKMPGKTWNADGYYTLSANSGRITIQIGAGVSYLRMQLNTGSAVSGQIFKFLRITARQYKAITNGNRPLFGVFNTNRKALLSYYNASDINMANIGQAISCYKNDMTEMKVNLIRQRYLVKSVSGNVITVAGISVQYFDIPSCFVAYTTAADDNAMVPVSAVSGQTITLTNPPPAEIVAGANIDFVITKTKTLL